MGRWLKFAMRLTVGRKERQVGSKDGWEEGKGNVKGSQQPAFYTAAGTYRRELFPFRSRRWSTWCCGIAAPCCRDVVRTQPASM